MFLQNFLMGVKRPFFRGKTALRAGAFGEHPKKSFTISGPIFTTLALMRQGDFPEGPQSESFTGAAG